MSIIRVAKKAGSTVKAVEPKNNKLSSHVQAAIANIEKSIESGDTSLLTKNAIPQLQAVIERLLR